MIRKLMALALALLLGAAALAEVYEGKTAALTSVRVQSDASGVLKVLEVEVGERVAEGCTLARLGGERVFASQDGQVSLVEVEVGEAAAGPVLKVAPLERYVLHCTVDSAYQAAGTMLVHSGETVYIRCTSDGSHRAQGIVTAIDGAEYRVLTLGGELYIGETVYLYRDADFTLEQRVGIGTVVANDTQCYESSGTVTRLCVVPGDTVERGQLLYELDGGEIVAPISGIVAAIEAQPGDAVEKEQAIVELVSDDQICVTLQLEETDAARIEAGQAAELLLDDEKVLSGAVLDVTWIAEEGLYTVRILPEEGHTLPLGRSVAVRI